MLKRHYILRCIIWGGLLLTGCASQRPMLFCKSDPIYYFNDIQAIPTPASVHYDRFEYYATMLPPRPAIRHLKTQSNQARDINSMDQIPASSWFFPRLGYEKLSPEALVAGPSELGPPHPPLRVFKIRNPEHNPRLFVADKRGIYYLLKMDPPDYPGMATNTSFIVNRLFWSFGYHVPEDHLFQFRLNDLQPARDSKLSLSSIQRLLQKVAPPLQGRYRAIASRIVKGLPLGPAPERGVREDDPNDFFPHQDRRSLRALGVFCAFTNWADIGPDNLLDVYVGKADQGYIKHYLVDFDDAFGTQAARKNALWAGYNHLFGVGEILINMITLGLYIQPWEQIHYTPWPSVGAFESTYFNPRDWKETHPFAPIRNSQPADDYWAAKVIAALSTDHLAALVRSADYTDPQAQEYMIRTLLERRHKCLQVHLDRVTPVEGIALLDTVFRVKDIKLGLFPLHTRTVEIWADTPDGETIMSPRPQRITSAEWSISVKDIHQNKNPDYYRLHIRDKSLEVEPAQFHFRRISEKSWKWVGVIH